MLLLRAHDIIKSITISEAISALKPFFLAQQNNNVVLPERVILPLKEQNGTAFFMPCFVNSPLALGIKVASFFHDNPKFNLSFVQGIFILINPQNGVIQAILDGNSLTAIRTGAVVGLATDYLASPHATSVAIIGAGTQSRQILNAVCSVRNIQTIYLYSRTSVSMQKFKNDMQDYADKIQTLRSCSEIKNADIVCTATSTTTDIPLLYSQDIKYGALVNSIGGSSKVAIEVDPQFLSQSLVVVETVSVALRESPEIQQAIEKKFIAQQDIVELGAIINANKPINRSVFFRADGIALEDIAIAQVIYKNALVNGLGQEISI